jgi:hypothetical protein
MNLGFISSGNILEEIIPLKTISGKKFLSNIFPLLLHGESQLSQDLSGASFSVAERFNDMVHSFLTNTELHSNVSLLNSAISLYHGIHSALVLITSHRNGSP